MYGVSTKVGAGIGETVHRVISALKKEGFGMRTNSEASASKKSRRAKARLSGPVRGACHLEFCHQAAGAESSAGLLPPFNVVLREGDDGNTRVLFLHRPSASDLMPNRQAPRQVSMLRAILGRVIDSLRD